jgi:hypothetical protein
MMTFKAEHKCLILSALKESNKSTAVNGFVSLSNAVKKVINSYVLRIMQPSPMP